MQQGKGKGNTEGESVAIVHKGSRQSLPDSMTLESNLEGEKRASFTNKWGRWKGRAKTLRQASAWHDENRFQAPSDGLGSLPTFMSLEPLHRLLGRNWHKSHFTHEKASTPGGCPASSHWPMVNLDMCLAWPWSWCSYTLSSVADQMGLFWRLSEEL